MTDIEDLQKLLAVQNKGQPYPYVLNFESNGNKTRTIMSIDGIIIWVSGFAGTAPISGASEATKQRIANENLIIEIARLKEITGTPEIQHPDTVKTYADKIMLVMGWSPEFSLGTPPNTFRADQVANDMAKFVINRGDSVLRNSALGNKTLYGSPSEDDPTGGTFDFLAIAVAPSQDPNLKNRLDPPVRFSPEEGLGIEDILEVRLENATP